MASYNQKQNSLIQQLKTIVGEKYLLTDPNRTCSYQPKLNKLLPVKRPIKNSIER